MSEQTDAKLAHECARDLRLLNAWLEGQASDCVTGGYCYPADELAARLQSLAKSLSRVQHLLPAALRQAVVPHTPLLDDPVERRKHFGGKTIRKVRNRLSAQAEWLENAATPPAEPSDATSEKTRPDIITLTVAIADYNVSRATLKRAVKARVLRSYRNASAPSNSHQLVDRNEVASRWPRRASSLS